MIFTYFAPTHPAQSLGPVEYAAEHARQTQPTSVHDLTLPDLFDWVEDHTRPGRKGDAGYIVAGDCRSSRRADAIGPAGFALLDYDDRPEGPDWEALAEYQGFAWTTAAGHPHWRVVIPFSEPIAHGALTCPFPGAHIRNRSQPAFLPTGDAVEWVALEGTKTLDGRALEAPRATAKPREIAATQLDEHDAQIAADLANVWSHRVSGDQAFGALGGWLRSRGVSDDRIGNIASRIADLTESVHPDPVARATDETCPTGRPKLQERLAIDADEAVVLLTLEDIERTIKDSVPGFVPENTPVPRVAEQPKPSGWLSWTDVMAPLPPLEWLCADLQLAPGRPCAIVAEPNSGKTWSLQAMALSVAANVQIFDHFNVQTPGPVLHVSTDAGEYATRWRYQMLAKGMKLAERDLAIHVWPGRLKCVTRRGEFDPNGLRPVIEQAAKMGAKLVILDSLFAIAAGLDMMSPEAAEPLWASKNLPGVWLWAMHTPKDKPGFFGSQAIGAACGVMWNMNLDGGDKNKPRIWTVGRRAEEYQGDALETFATQWDRDMSDEGLLLSGRISYVPQDAVRTLRPALEVRDRVLAALDEGALNQTQLKVVLSGIKMRWEDKLVILQEIVDSRAIACSKNGKQMTYRLGNR